MDERLPRIMAELRQVLDPELGVNVVDLGLVYGVVVDGDRVEVRLTMTTPACPLSDSIVREATERLLSLPGTRDARVELVWDPPWSPERMTPAGREALGWG